jgi:hypothetical protein
LVLPDSVHVYDLKCLMCVISPLSALCSATVVQAHIDFGSPVYKIGYNYVLVLWCQKHGTAHWWTDRIETYTNGVCCEAFNVENCNGKKL